MPTSSFLFVHGLEASPTHQAAPSWSLSGILLEFVSSGIKKKEGKEEGRSESYRGSYQ